MPLVIKDQSIRKSLKELLWRKVDLPFAVTDDDCWLWTGLADKDGYGKIKSGGKNLRAHRVSFELHRRDPGNWMVCHTCDSPACVNPSHLFLGSALDNNRDAISKGRRTRFPGMRKPRKGENHPLAKLSAEDVRLIREGLANGLSKSALAKIFKVSRCPIQRIAKGIAWRSV